jgi:hypothetical protein
MCNHLGIYSVLLQGCEGETGEMGRCGEWRKVRNVHVAHDLSLGILPMKKK